MDAPLVLGDGFEHRPIAFRLGQPCMGDLGLPLSEGVGDALRDGFGCRLWLLFLALHADGNGLRGEQFLPIPKHLDAILADADL